MSVIADARKFERQLRLAFEVSRAGEIDDVAFHVSIRRHHYAAIHFDGLVERGAEAVTNLVLIGINRVEHADRDRRACRDLDRRRRRRRLRRRVRRSIVRGRGVVSR